MIIDTPCIGICSSVYGDPICRGCKRTAHEVIDWNRYSAIEKEVVYSRLQSNMATILFDYIEIVDAALLQEKIIQLNIRLHSKATAVDHAFHLLRLGAHKIKQLDRYGLCIKPPFVHMSLPALFTQIDEKIYAKAIDSNSLKDLK